MYAAYNSSHSIKGVDLVCLCLYINIDLLHDHSVWKPSVQSTSQMPTKLSGGNSSYQESATLPVSHKNDEGAVLREDDDGDASDDIDANDWGRPGLTGVRR
jgi:hypothetical protein